MEAVRRKKAHGTWQRKECKPKAYKRQALFGHVLPFACFLLLTSPIEPMVYWWYFFFQKWQQMYNLKMRLVSLAWDPCVEMEK